MARVAAAGGVRRGGAVLTALIELSGVGKTYRSMRGANYQALKDFDLKIQEGEFLCLLGTSGCGKTTVLNMVAGFEAQTEGQITVHGRKLTGPGPDRGGRVPGRRLAVFLAFRAGEYRIRFADGGRA